MNQGDRYQVLISKLPVPLLTEAQLRMAPGVYLGDAWQIAKRFPRNEYPTLVSGVLVESRNGENSHYLSLLKWDPTNECWKPAEKDPRSC
jgi:hypothetical protein